MSPVLRAPMLYAISPQPRGPPPESVWVIGNLYFYNNSRTLYEQNVEALNADFRRFFSENPNPGELYWYPAEYRRELNKLKDMYQSPFVGKILTCGMSDMCALGINLNRTVPKQVKFFKEHNIVKISCGSTYTLMIDKDGKVFSFGSQDEGGMGRDGPEYEGDLRVRGFVPHKNSRCPVENDDDCIIKVEAGYAKSLALSLHNNVYTMGCFRDYDDTQIREKPLDVSEPDKNGRLYPRGSNFSPVHLYDMPPGVVTDLACGNFMNAAIVGGKLVTWGVGTKGELGRPLPKNAAIRNKETGNFYTDIIDEHLMKPTIVPSLRDKVAISVACGQGHLVVVVRERGSLESMLYASGLNGDGQLGLGDCENRKVLTPVSMHRYLFCVSSDFHATHIHSFVCLCSSSTPRRRT